MADWLIPIGGLVLFLFLYRQVQAPGGRGTQSFPDGPRLTALTQALSQRNVSVKAFRQLPTSPLGTVQSFPLRDGSVCFSPAAIEHMGDDLWVLAGIAVAVHRSRRQLLVQQLMRPLAVAVGAAAAAYIAQRQGADPRIGIMLLFGALLLLIPWQRKAMSGVQGIVDRISVEVIGDVELTFRVLARRALLNRRLRTRPDERADVLGLRRVTAFGRHAGIEQTRRKALIDEVERSLDAPVETKPRKKRR